MSLNYYQDENDLFLQRKLIEIVNESLTTFPTLGAFIHSLSLYGKERFIKGNTLDSVIEYYQSGIINIEIIQEKDKAISNGIYTEMAKMNNAGVIGGRGNKEYFEYLKRKLKKYELYEQQRHITESSIILEILKDSDLISYFSRDLKVKVTRGENFGTLVESLITYVDNFIKNSLVSSFAYGFESHLVKAESQLNLVLWKLTQLVYGEDKPENMLQVGHLPSPERRAVKQGQNYAYPYQYKLQECFYYLEKLGFITILEVSPARFIINATELFTTEPADNEQLFKMKETIQNYRLGIGGLANRASDYLNHLQEAKYKELTQKESPFISQNQLDSLKRTIYETEKTLAEVDKELRIKKRLSEDKEFTSKKEYPSKEQTGIEAEFDDLTLYKDGDLFEGTNLIKSFDLKEQPFKMLSSLMKSQNGLTDRNYYQINIGVNSNNLSFQTTQDYIRPILNKTAKKFKISKKHQLEMYRISLRK